MHYEDTISTVESESSLFATVSASPFFTSHTNLALFYVGDYQSFSCTSWDCAGIKFAIVIIKCDLDDFRFC